MSNTEVKKKKLHNLRLTKYELLHIRDLFSISLPPDARKTVSQALAETEERVFVEANLWNKVSNLCFEAELPVDDDAPDYMIVPISHPTLGVFQVASEPDSIQEEILDESEKNFIKDDSEKDE